MNGPSFHLYGVIIGVAAVVWWSMVEHLEPKLKPHLPRLIIISLIGARLYHVFEYFTYYQAQLWRVFYVWEGGLSIWGAIIAGFFGVKILSSKLEIRKNEISNIFSAIVTPLPLAQAIGRLANGVNNEFVSPVLGIPWWGMEALLDLVLFGMMLLIAPKYRAVVYLVGYGLIRLVLQPYRL